MTQIDKFIHHVEKMREAQISYFKTRGKYSLMNARRLEQQVDRDLKELTPKLPNQPQQQELFK